MITYPVVRDQDLTPLNTILPRQCSSPLGGPVTPCYDDETVMDNVIQEFDADGNMVLGLVGDGRRRVLCRPRPSSRRGSGLLPGEPNGGEIDPFHMNSLEAVNDGTGDYVASLAASRHGGPHRSRLRGPRLDARGARPSRAADHRR